MGFAGARYDVCFVITYGFVWIVFPNVSLSFTIFLCEVYGSRERDRPPLIFITQSSNMVTRMPETANDFEMSSYCVL